MGVLGFRLAHEILLLNKYHVATFSPLLKVELRSTTEIDTIIRPMNCDLNIRMYLLLHKQIQN